MLLGKGMEYPAAKAYWRGLFVVILSTPTAVKVVEIAPWIHHSRASFFQVGVHS
jgi:hypothetical protein